MTSARGVLGRAATCRRLAVVLLSTALIKFIYVFGLTDYSSYIYSDAAHYFGRATAFYQGQRPYHGDWDVFPMGSSVLLAAYWKTLYVLFGLDTHFLESALVLNIAAGTVAVACVWRLAARLTESPRLALWIALAYGLFFPLVYLSAFIVSEHGANLFFLVSTVALVEARHRARPLRWIVAAGVFWALACQLRGAYLSCLPAIAGVICLHGVPQNAVGRWRSLMAFGAGGAAVFFAASLALWGVSGGESHKPTGNNGGFNFFQQQCHYNGVETHQGNFVWYFHPALYSNDPQLGTYVTTVPFPEQGFYFREGFRCLSEQPGALGRLVAIGPTMLYSQIFPDQTSAAGYERLMPWMRHLNVLLLLLTPAGYLALRRTQPMAANLLLWNALALWATYAAVNADHRHVYSLSFIYLVLGLYGLVALRHRSPRARAAYLAAAIAAVGLGVALFTGRGPLALFDNKPLTIRASLLDKPVPNGTPWTALETLRFWAPVTIELGGLVHAPVLRLSLDANDVYTLAFQRADAKLGTVQLSLARTQPAPVGMISRKIAVPPAIAAGGYDRLVLTPVSGDNRYAVADLRLEDADPAPR